MRMSRGTRIHVDCIEKIPTGEHWAIFENSSVHHEEVGVWAPGHGYPAYSENIVNYYAYTDKAEFEADLVHAIDEGRKFGGRSVRGIHVSGIFTSTTSIQLAEGK